MNREGGIPNGDEWRRMAEERMLKLREQATEPSAADDMAKMVHELMVHQVELELQNEELIEARAELESNSELLAELYEFAPVGYF